MNYFPLSWFLYFMETFVIRWGGSVLSQWTQTCSSLKEIKHGKGLSKSHNAWGCSQPPHSRYSTSYADDESSPDSIQVHRPYLSAVQYSASLWSHHACRGRAHVAERQRLVAALKVVVLASCLFLSGEVVPALQGHLRPLLILCFWLLLGTGFPLSWFSFTAVCR